MLFRFSLVLFGLILSSQTIKAQSQFSLTPGVFYNGGILREYTGGAGGVLGLEYLPRQNHFFALEVRSRYGFYFFDDGANWSQNKDGSWEPPIRDVARLEYNLFSPQIGIVPKFYLHFDETLSFFLENEFSGGLMTGRFKYKGNTSTKKNFTESIFYYCISGGVELKDGKKWSLLISVGYSTLDFKNKIKRRQPVGYQGKFSNQEAPVMFNMIFKLPLTKN
jgi:hypothetical protein